MDDPQVMMDRWSEDLQAARENEDADYLRLSMLSALILSSHSNVGVPVDVVQNFLELYLHIEGKTKEKPLLLKNNKKRDHLQRQKAILAAVIYYANADDQKVTREEILNEYDIDERTFDLWKSEHLQFEGWGKKMSALGNLRERFLEGAEIYRSLSKSKPK